jgi:CelD/BcsL family acetyltransferase involved in cellulose biosynthesis
MNAPTSHSETLLPDTRAMVGGLVLRVHDNLDDVEAAWRALEDEGIATFYQSFDWCNVWCKRVGVARGIKALVVVGENAFGQPQFIMPLQLRLSRGFKIIEALTAPQGAYAGWLLTKAIDAYAQSWMNEYFDHVLAALPPHDVFQLADIPARLFGKANPLLAARHFSSANQSHFMALQPDYRALYERKRSGRTRSSMRQRDQLLEASGELIFDLPIDMASRVETLRRMFAQQKQRLSEFGVHDVFDAVEEQFIVDLASVETPEGPLLRPYRLLLNGEILAVMLGGYRHQTYWALISSLGHGAVRKQSPGDYALRHTIAALCADGTQKLDFSAGDTAYKYRWSDEQFALNLIIRASSFKGMPLALAMLVREKLKRFAKRTPVLNDLLFKLRRKIRGSRG